MELLDKVTPDLALDMKRVSRLNQLNILIIVSF